MGGRGAGIGIVGFDERGRLNDMFFKLPICWPTETPRVSETLGVWTPMGEGLRPSPSSPRSETFGDLGAFCILGLLLLPELYPYDVENVVQDDDKTNYNVKPTVDLVGRHILFKDFHDDENY